MYIFWLFYVFSLLDGLISSENPGICERSFFDIVGAFEIVCFYKNYENFPEKNCDIYEDSEGKLI